MPLPSLVLDFIPNVATHAETASKIWDLMMILFWDVIPFLQFLLPPPPSGSTPLILASRKCPYWYVSSLHWYTRYTSPDYLHTSPYKCVWEGFSPLLTTSTLLKKPTPNCKLGPKTHPFIELFQLFFLYFNFFFFFASTSPVPEFDLPPLPCTQYTLPFP